MARLVERRRAPVVRPFLGASRLSGTSAQAPPRRTQRERRAAPEAKLIDATVQSLVELGYTRTSVKEICTRAGVSPGGLFGRFESRLDLIIAAAAEVGTRQIERFTRRYARAVGNEDRICRRHAVLAANPKINGIYAARNGTIAILGTKTWIADLSIDH